MDDKKLKIEIDLSIWSTPTDYAAEKGIRKQDVNNWIKRENIEHWYIEELGLRLVKRNSERFKFKKMTL
jgi:uncharacterized protein (UPF0303 family)